MLNDNFHLLHKTTTTRLGDTAVSPNIETNREASKRRKQRNMFQKKEQDEPPTENP